MSQRQTHGKEKRVCEEGRWDFRYKVLFLRKQLWGLCRTEG